MIGVLAGDVREQIHRQRALPGCVCWRLSWGVKKPRKKHRDAVAGPILCRHYVVGKGGAPDTWGLWESGRNLIVENGIGTPV